MPAGTETFLIYNVTLDFTDKPTNLKFYKDIEKQQEVLLENNKYIAFNGFMTWDSSDNKIRQQTYYWDWPYETGEVDENGIAEGDAEDLKFAGKTMSMNITATGTQVLANTLEGKVATTLINGELGVHDTVQDAVNTADNHNGALVTLLENQMVDGITIADTENIVLDLNGRTLTVTNSVINNGSLTIVDSSKTVGNVGTGKIISNSNTVIKNAGTGELTIAAGTIESTLEDIAEIDAENPKAISCSSNSTLKITGGKINAIVYALYTEDNAIVTISGGKVKSTGAQAIYHSSENILIIKNDTSVIATTNHGIRNSGAGTVKMDGGSVVANSRGIVNVVNGGKIIVTGGTITAGDCGVGNQRCKWNNRDKWGRNS